MLVFRLIVLLLLIASALSFAMYIGTGQMRWRAIGLTCVKWAIVAGLGFFAVLALERLV